MKGVLFANVDRDKRERRLHSHEIPVNQEKALSSLLYC